MLILLFSAIIIVELSGKLSKIKFMTSAALLVSSGNERNLKGHQFCFQVHSEFQRKTTQNPKFALSIFPRIQNVKVSKEFVGTLSRRLAFKKDTVPTICTSLWKVESPELDKQTAKNKLIMLSEEWANSSFISRVKKGLYLDTTLSPRTTHSLKCAASFVKPSAVFVFLTPLPFFRVFKCFV